MGSENMPGKYTVESLVDEHDRVAIANVMHEKHARGLSKLATTFKAAQVILMTLTTCSALVVIFGETHLAAIITGLLAALALGVELTQLKFEFEREIVVHTEVAFKLWSLRDRYRILYHKVLDGAIDAPAVDAQLTILRNEKEIVFRVAPAPYSKYHTLARLEISKRLLGAEKS